MLAACSSSAAATPALPSSTSAPAHRSPTPTRTLPSSASASATSLPTLPPASDPYFASDGGGEPRSAAYWKLWSSCTESNQAAVATANGGRAAGWIILDDLLADPGMRVGRSAVETCEQGVRVLDRMDAAGNVKGDDAAYGLAVQLLTGQLNLAVGAEFCPAVQDAVQAGQLLLLSAGFDGAGDSLGPASAPDDRELARFLAEQLAAYNAGQLCQ